MRSHRVLLVLAVAPLTACATGETGNLGGLGGQGSTSSNGSGGSSTNAAASVSSSSSSTTGSSTTSGTSGSGGVPTSCTEANNFVGCCDGTGTLYYCPKSSMKLTSKACPSGQACGWEASMGYYGCTTSPGGPDPSGKYPMACP